MARFGVRRLVPLQLLMLLGEVVPKHWRIVIDADHAVAACPRPEAPTALRMSTYPSFRSF